MRLRRGCLVVLTSLLLASCTTEQQPPAPAPAPASLAPHADCAHPPKLGTAGIEGDADGGSVVALVFATAVKAKTSVKIAWRVTGTGPVRFTATGPGERTIPPDWGPEAHGGSTFRFPGDEWGTGFTFPVPGCWTVHIRRDNLTATMDLPVG